MMVWDKNKFFALVERGDKNEVKKMLNEKDADINVKDERGGTTLHHAAYGGHIDMFRMLVKEFGLDPKIVTNNGTSVLHSSASGGNIDMLRMLVKEFNLNPKLVDNDGDTALNYALGGGHADMFRMLVKEFDLDPKVKGSTGNTILNTTARIGNIEIFRILVNEFNLDPKAKNDDGGTALHFAAYGGQIDMFRILVKEFDLDPKAITNSGLTVLHTAARGGNDEMFRFLVKEFGLDPKQVDHNNATSLHYAAKGGNIEMFRMLVKEFGLDPKSKDNNNDTPENLSNDNVKKKIISDKIVLKVKSGDRADVQKLLDIHPSLLNGKYEDGKVKGKTLLMFAAESGDVLMVRFLLKQKGVDISVEDSTKLSAEDYSANEQIKLEISRSGKQSVNNIDTVSILPEGGRYRSDLPGAKTNISTFSVMSGVTSYIHEESDLRKVIERVYKFNKSHIRLLQIDVDSMNNLLKMLNKDIDISKDDISHLEEALKIVEADIRSNPDVDEAIFKDTKANIFFNEVKRKLFQVAINSDDVSKGRKKSDSKVDKVCSSIATVLGVIPGSSIAKSIAKGIGKVAELRAKSDASDKSSMLSTQTQLSTLLFVKDFAHTLTAMCKDNDDFQELKQESDLQRLASIAVERIIYSLSNDINREDNSRLSDAERIVMLLEAVSKGRDSINFNLSGTERDHVDMAAISIFSSIALVQEQERQIS